MKKKLEHLAIIMDGNGRWAERRGLARSDGHKKGAEVVRRVMRFAKKHGIRYLTLYAFSTENWKRPPQEVLYLMKLLERFLTDRLPELMEEDVRLLSLGRIDGLPAGAREKLLEVMEKTKANQSGNLILALNYGGRAELTDAIRKMTEDVTEGRLNPSKIDEKTVAKYLYAPGIPDPDLIVRTSGEQRLSNFLLYESAYSELYFTDVLWPDFDEADFDAAVDAYYSRSRRLGGV